MVSDLEVVVKEKSETELEIRVKGETYSLIVPLAERLSEFEEVIFAGYDVPHPLIDEGVLYLRVKEGVDPLSTLKKAAEMVINELEELEDSFKRELSSFRR